MTAPPRIRRVLVANRGEIALRIFRTAHALGYGTVAVHGPLDGEAAHVDAADQSVALRRSGPDSPENPYLDVDAVLDAARRTRADAIHPGYGFLSEQPALPRACAEAGIVFVGPGPRAMETMGDKRAAAGHLRGSDVPQIPGYAGDAQDPDTLLAEAARIGFPLMLKAAAGGGGKGMRRVEDAADFPDAARRVQAEARAAFGEGSLLLERYFADARHVEVQVAADAHGACVALGARDCSSQRRFQKIIEECPPPGVSDGTLRAMYGAAVTVARSCDYLGLGTVEFLLDADGGFYFLEMNTRLQVEHAVTEMVTGLDLVALQFRLAEGAPLPLTQDDFSTDGHAIEARIYAESPAAGFLPQTGQVRALRLPQGPGVRIDHALRQGADVSAQFDPMLAKLIAHGPDRPSALARLRRALSDLVLLGVPTNRDFLLRVLAHPSFEHGGVGTAFVATAGETLTAPDTSSPAMVAACAVAHLLAGPGRTRHSDDLRGYSNAGPIAWPLHIEMDGAVHHLAVSRRGETLQVASGDGSTVEVEGARLESGRLLLAQDGVRASYAVHIAGTQLWLDDGRNVRTSEDVTARAPDPSAALADGTVCAPMEATVVEVSVHAGQSVRTGDGLLVLEAMKLQHRVLAPVDGTVASLSVAAGEQVGLRQVLAVVEEQDA